MMILQRTPKLITTGKPSRGKQTPTGGKLNTNDKKPRGEDELY
jgi:hypothetical protein